MVHRPNFLTGISYVNSCNKCCFSNLLVMANQLTVLVIVVMATVMLCLTATDAYPSEFHNIVLLMYMFV